MQSQSFVTHRGKGRCWLLAVLGALLFGVLMPASAQHTWQKPLPPRSQKEIDRIIGPMKPSKLDRPLKIIWVWSKHDHGPGFHEYEKVRDRFKELLEKVPQVKVESAYKFPSAEQWQNADLVVFYLHETQPLCIKSLWIRV